MRRPGGGMRDGGLRCVGLFMLLAIFLSLSCSCRSDSAAFARGLSSADEAIAGGDTKKALASLAALRKKAVGVSNWLSVAKRERSLGFPQAAIITLEKGLSVYRSNQLLAAVLADTCVEMGRYDEASLLRSELAGSAFFPLVAYADVLRTKATFPPDIDPAVWVSAFEASGEPSFLGNAATLYAVRGMNAEALALANRRFVLDGSQGLFPALLSYDAGFAERVSAYLTRPDGDLNADELALVADAEFVLGNAGRARALWGTIIERYPAYSPIPWYNRAISETDWANEKIGLESCLARYPAYYPAVCRYARGVSLPKEVEPGVIEEELRDAGFRTLEMEIADAGAPVDPDRAAKALERALAFSDDIRFKIENLRFKQLANPDEGRTSGDMWKLLEKYPRDPVLVAYAQWYFASLRQYDATFGLGNGTAGSVHDFWAGMAAAMAGDLDRSAECFGSVASDESLAWCALANLAKVLERGADLSGAAENYATAIALAPDDRIRSSLSVESARISIRMGDSVRARQLLGYALDLDAGNYAARAMLKNLEPTR